LNIKELKELLDQYPDNTPVLIARDEEGNGFNHLNDYGFSHYTEDGYEVEVHHPNDIENYKEEALMDGEDYVEPPKALVLWS
jgi:hypothetical protein